MKKIIAALAMLLLAVSSAQAVTVLIDENFNSLPEHVDLDTLSGWTNNNGTGVFPIFTTYRDIDPVDVGRGIHKYEGEYGWSNYSYAVPDVTLGAGEFYRFESFWHVTDGPVNVSASGMPRIYHSDGRRAQWFYNAGDELVCAIYDSDGTSRLHRADVLPILPSSVTDIRLRIDLGPDGVNFWYNPGEAPGSGWVLFSQALASEDPLFGFTGGITEVAVNMFSYTNLDWPQADSLSLTVESSAAIPEPTTICLLALAGTVLLARRRR